eukprot:6204633-Pleurochrysis_carterae.AAC.1
MSSVHHASFCWRYSRLMRPMRFGPVDVRKLQLFARARILRGARTVRMAKFARIYGAMTAITGDARSKAIVCSLLRPTLRAATVVATRRANLLTWLSVQPVAPAECFAVRVVPVHVRVRVDGACTVQGEGLARRSRRNSSVSIAG